MFRFILIILGLFFIHLLANGSAQQLDILNDLYHKCQLAAENFDYQKEYKYSEELQKLAR